MLFTINLMIAFYQAHQQCYNCTFTLPFTKKVKLKLSYDKNVFEFL